MATTNTSFALGDHFARFVNEQVETGRYATASEVIRAGLRLLEENERRTGALRRAINEGEQSGAPEPFDFDEFLTEMRGKHAA